MKMIKLFGLLLIIFITGCSKEKTMICNIDVNNNIQNYSIEGLYKIYYKDNFVTRIEKKEKYLSEDKSVIDFFKESKELEFYNLSDRYGGVKYSIKSTDNSVSIEIKINLKEFNVSQMKKDGNIDVDYVLNSKLKISGIKRIYEEKGAICD